MYIFAKTGIIGNVRKVNEMERTAARTLEKWLACGNRKPMIVWGARQVGKTYLVRNLFAEKHFKDSCIYVDFKKETDIRNYILEADIVDAAKITEFLSYRFNRKIDRNTLLIFDEIQECLPAITALKYFRQDMPEQPVIATGSMVRIKLKREQAAANRRHAESYFFPVGAISQLTIHPMTFEEYLLNSNEMLLDALSAAWNEQRPLEDWQHAMAMEALYKYLLIGGMPEALNIYLTAHSGAEARETLVTLYDNYLNDMNLYQASRDSVVRAKAVYKNIYTQLNKEQKNFRSSLVDKSLRSRDLKTPIDWLEEAKLIYKSQQLNEHVTIPLTDNGHPDFRLYMADTGMFAYQSGINMATFIDPNAVNTLSGIFFENFAAAELTSAGIPLFYWKGKNSAEFEFVTVSSSNVIPIDVKKKHGTLKSLEKFREHNSCKLAVKISANKYGYSPEQKLLTVPLYQTFLLADSIKNNTLVEHSRIS